MIIVLVSGNKVTINGNYTSVEVKTNPGGVVVTPAVNGNEYTITPNGNYRIKVTSGKGVGFYNVTIPTNPEEEVEPSVDE